MGKVISLVHQDTIHAKPIFSKRISIEKAETYHLHYRNLRLEFTRENFVHFCESVIEAYENMKKGKGKKVPGQTFLAYNAGIDESKAISPDELKIEYCANLYADQKHSIFGRFANFYEDHTYVHLHIRELRIELAMTVFESLVQGAIHAYTNHIQHQSGTAIESVRELFETLNSRNIRYVVMRNWDEIVRNQLPKKNPDIDFMIEADDVPLFDSLTHASLMHLHPLRVQRRIFIGSGQRRTQVHVDLRTPLDQYYPENLARKLLKTRQRDGGVYVAHGDAYLHSLLYHAHFHKPELSEAYAKKLTILAGKKKVPKWIADRRTARTLLDRRGYPVIEPLDASVQFHP